MQKRDSSYGRSLPPFHLHAGCEFAGCRNDVDRRVLGPLMEERIEDRENLQVSLRIAAAPKPESCPEPSSIPCRR